MRKTKCLIIGSGPSGFTAAIYASRANMQPLLYTGEQVGGQLTTTNDVENFPGYPNGVTGPELMADLEAQARRFGTEIVYEKIVSTDFTDNYKIAVTESGEIIHADTVIISTGASAKYLGLPNEQRLNGYGVSACAVCDGFFYKDKIVAVVGGGDTACEEAVYLSNITEKVYMIVRSDLKAASQIMRDRVLYNDKIEILYNTTVIDVLGENEVIGIRVTDKKPIINESIMSDTVYIKEEESFKDISINGLFVAIGHTPNSDIFTNIEKDKNGYIITNNTKTNISGVFACGDVQDTIYRQAITAAGTGCMSALEAEKYLNHV
jgi:thioredoxin reductase (NADPH)